MNVMNSHFTTNIVIGLLSCLLATAAMTSCDKSTDHRLRQNWKFERYEFADGTTRDIDSVFINFMKGSMSAIFAYDGHPDYIALNGAYSLTGDSIELQFSDETSMHEVWRPLFDRYFGWGSLKHRFRIQSLTSSALVLERGDTTMYMTKH